jgi:RHH-type proline utilization regulon transcriptional repressor/proline dehydrogenase/delta 1-pyrroline-5-carboxylate dehydrogenase
VVAPAINAAAYEPQTQEIGRRLLAATQSRGSFFAQVRDQMRWEDRMLAWTMENPGLRVQLFRLIDCLPSLQSKGEIARHMQEYLADESVELPAALKNLLSFTQPESVPGQLAATTFTTAVEALARKYIAGEALPQAIKSVERLRRDKLGFTVDLLGEAVISEKEAQSYLDRYLDVMEQLATASRQWPEVAAIDRADGESLPRVQVSVKLTAFYSQFDPLDEAGSAAGVSDRIRILLRRARELGVAVHFDMEQYAYKDATLTILKDVLLEDEFRDRDDIGVTLQAYLRDSDRDLRDLIQWAKQRGTPVTVRLVKGAYWDQETIHALQNEWLLPVFRYKSATDANFEQLTRLLLENHEYLYAAIGSHNVRSQAYAIAIARNLNIPKRRYELQVLYGMADKLAKALAEEGCRVRVYCPYGDLIPGMSYLIRRLLENTANSSFLRQSVSDVPAEVLLALPSQQEVTVPISSPGFRNAANADFSQAKARTQVQQALQSVRQRLGLIVHPFIGGQWISTERWADSVNPSNPTEIVGRIQLAGLPEVEQVIAAAKAAFPTWKATPARERANCLRRAADLMEQRRAELTAWMVLETGKPAREADAEVSEAVDFCRYYAAEMERLDAGSASDLPGETNRYRYQPRGLAVVISPWNFSLAIPTGMTVAALVAGNCTILKPSTQSCIIASKLAEILVEAGMPAGVFQFLPGSGSEVGMTLVNHPDVHLITFTGSQEVGCRIYADAAILRPGQKHLKRVIAEMGGKNGIIIDESADLDQAVQGVVQSAFSYSGQKCSACSRAIVLEPIYDTFLERLVEATRSLGVGAAELASTSVGPVIDAAAHQRIRTIVEQGRSEAVVALELETPPTGYFIGPTIFKDVDPHSSLAQQEIFGPVLAVLRASDFETALAIANNTPYALTGGLYSRTPAHIERARQEFEVGNLYINRGITGAIVNRQAFGGFKLSGVGSKAGGPDYLLQFLEPRVVTENTQRQGFAPIDEETI